MRSKNPNIGTKRLRCSSTSLSSLSLYLLLVWGFALVRHDYLWIDGDDPNLLTQAALTHNGLKPNLDFESGYPGLSQFIQADLMHLFGVNIFSQHLYTAILASLTGFLICLNFPKIPQWLLSVGLILIYCQQHLVNPTPNPGHLFELFLITVFTVTNKKLKLRGKTIFYVSFTLLGLAFLAKQYAIFVLFGYTISQFEKAQWKKLDSKKRLILLGFGVLAATLYFVLLIPDGNLKKWATVTLVVMVLPYVLLNLMLHGKKSIKMAHSLSDSTKNVIAGTLIFLMTVLIGFVVLYQSYNLKDILYQVLIEAPRRINDNVVLLSINTNTLISFFAFLIFSCSTIYLIKSQYSNKNWRAKDFIRQAAVIFIGTLAFTKIGNLSTTIIMVLLPIVIIYSYFKLDSEANPDCKQFFFVLTCYQFVLIPYPNVNFHMMIWVVACLILIRDKFGDIQPTRMKHLWTFPVILVALLLVHEVKTIDSMKTYNFQEVHFKSNTTAWNLAIKEAVNSNGELASCSTIGCKMLVLIPK